MTPGANFSWIVYEVPSRSESCSVSFWFCGRMSHNALTWAAFISFGLYFCRMKYMVSVPACVFRLCDRWPSLLHTEFFHTGASFLTRSLYQNTSVWYHIECGFPLVPLRLHIFEGIYVCHRLFLCEVSFLPSAPLETLQVYC